MVVGGGGGGRGDEVASVELVDGKCGAGDGGGGNGCR